MDSENQHNACDVLPQQDQDRTNTPVAKKTRRAMRKKTIDSDTVPEDLLPKTEEGLKSPCATSFKLETPRRSARKSVRPPLDYEDIVEKHSHPAGKDTSNIIGDAEELATQKWNAAEVGRHSRKRSRKAKRAAIKKSKNEEIEIANDEEIAATVAESTDKTQVESNTVPEPVLIETFADVEDLGVRPLDAGQPMEEEVDDIEAMPSLILQDDGQLCSSADQLIIIQNTNVDAIEQQNQDRELSTSANILNTTFDAEEQQTEKKEPIPAEKIKVVLTNVEDQNTTLFNVSTFSEKMDIPRNSAKKALSGTQTVASKKPEVALSSNGKTLTVTSIVRRRSKSVSQLNNTVKGVSFYSPIEITHTNEIDMRWEGKNDSNVTQRRKRSISLDDCRYKPSKIPKPMVSTQIKPTKDNTPRKLQARTKLPDFAKIHQKQFGKMENLIELMQRKEERAKMLLTNSAAKRQQQSAGLTPKSTAKKLVGSKTSAAYKKLDLSSAAVLLPTPTKPIELERQRLLLLKLPKPCLMTAAAASQAKAKTVATHSNLPVRAPFKSALSSSAVVAKPAFNLSTALVKTFVASTTTTAVSDATATTTTKMQDRRQRHMEMFKGRTAKKRAGQENKAEFIRGVRSNRRFDLQMQHRRHIDEN